MIKRIPIKGISRDPSGQVAADGFCAESLNVQSDMGEVAPVIKPQPVKDASGEEIQVDGDILYIHKGIGYENLIYRAGNALSFLVTVGDAQPGLVYDGLTDDEVINDIKAIGNTIVLSTSKDMYYILWKEGAYRFLGSQIPIPAIHFRTGNLDAIREVPDVIPEVVEEHPFLWTEENAPIFPHDSVGQKTEYGSPAKKYTFDGSEYEAFWAEYLASVWGKIDSLVQEQRAVGKAIFPIFVRYAVRLYDGTLYAQSIPVLLGADISRFVDVKSVIFQAVMTIEGKETHSFTNIKSYVSLAKGYSVVMRTSGQGSVFDGWEDIVTSVDLFISAQMMAVQRNAAKFCVEYKQELIGGSRVYKLKDFVIDPYYTVQHQEELVLNNQNTFLAKSFTLDEFRRLDGDKVLEDIDFSSDYIMAQEPLKETPWSMHHTVGEHMSNYNNRLMLTDVKQKLYHGYPFLPSVKWLTGEMGVTYRFVYHLRGENGQNKVICRDVAGNAQITPEKAAIVSESGTLYEEFPVAWLAYPDSRCYQIDVYRIGRPFTTFASYKTKRFSLADVSYVFFGFGTSVYAEMPAQSIPSGESPIYNMPNTLVVSKANNPFVFPAEDTATFNAGRILNLAVATKALSEGQFGQFPLYVFTDEGVFAMSVDSQGAFQDSHPVSRDVLVSREALTGIEQGVFFAAARGLLLLQGSEVTKVSELMDGPATSLDRVTRALISGMYRFPVAAPDQFYKFLSGCKLAYDYANTRIILFRNEDETQYVYKFDTQSWHRMSAGTWTIVRALNSFPEALVVTKDRNAQSVRNLSVNAESDGAEAVPGLIYTRDLILDNADIYKSISKLKVRGRFLDGHVKWLLYGSNDGINYRNLHSLRGPSWKWYRIAIVSMLDPGERISYIELDYSPRFTDKIR